MAAFLGTSGSLGKPEAVCQLALNPDYAQNPRHSVNECNRLIVSFDNSCAASRHGWKIATLLLQFRVLRFGFFQDGDVRVGVFPEGEEILICRLGFGGVALQGVSATDLEMRQRT